MKIHALILSAGFVLTMHAQTNLVANGSFEAGPTGEGVFTDWGWVAGADNNSDFGVALATGGSEVAEQGNNFAYFRGHPTDSSQDCLGTGVNLKPGGIYKISYYLRTDGPLTNGAAMWAQIGTSFGLDPSQDTTLPEFFPNSNGIAVTNSGILLDNVSMVLTYPHLKVNFTPPGSLTFAWQFTNSPYRLQSNGSLKTTSWATLSNVPSNVGTNSQIVLAAPGGAQFYRITLP